MGAQYTRSPVCAKPGCGEPRYWPFPACQKHLNLIDYNTAPAIVYTKAEVSANLDREPEPTCQEGHGEYWLNCEECQNDLRRIREWKKLRKSS